MGRDIDSPPDEWAGMDLKRVPGSPDPGVFVGYVESWGDDDLHRLVIAHWHTPTACPHCGRLPEADGEHSCSCPHRHEECPDHLTTWDRWQFSGVGNHALVALEPLHLEPSLGCEGGCPSHGWIRGGVWTDA